MCTGYYRYYFFLAHNIDVIIYALQTKWFHKLFIENLITKYIYIINSEKIKKCNRAYFCIGGFQTQIFQSIKFSCIRHTMAPKPALERCVCAFELTAILSVLRNVNMALNGFCFLFYALVSIPHELLLYFILFYFIILCFVA